MVSKEEKEEYIQDGPFRPEPAVSWSAVCGPLITVLIACGAEASVSLRWLFKFSYKADQREVSSERG